MALTNSEAYEANKKSKEMHDKIIEKSTLNLKNQIQNEIDKAINNGKFKCEICFNSKNALISPVFLKVSHAIFLIISFTSFFLKFYL
jgi:hypothetical protein